MQKFFLLLILFLINSCATVMQSSREIPSYISQEDGHYSIHFIFDHIPNYSFFLDEEEVHHDLIRYQKTELGHLIKVPVKEHHQDIKIRTSLKTLLHKKIRLNSSPQKLMMITSYSRPLLKAIDKENPDFLIVFAPPESLYYSEKDFISNPIFSLPVLRPIYFVGHKQLKSSFQFNDFAISDIEEVASLDRPALLTHYLPFTHAKSASEFSYLSENLRKNESPVLFLSSFPTNLIQQIPRGQLGLPTYEFSVKNNFLALSQEADSPWEVINERRADYLTLDFKFIDSYWHILLKAKDDNQELVFSRDLTLYQTRPLDGRNRRNAR